MKRPFPFIASLCLMLLAFVGLAACQHTDEAEPHGLTIHLSQEAFAQRDVRAGTVEGSADESLVSTLTLVVVDASGNVQTVGGKKVWNYKIATNGAFGDNPTWKNNQSSTQTIVLNQFQHSVLNNVRLVVLANLSQTVANKVDAGTITTLDDLNKEVNLTITTADGIKTPFLIAGTTAAFSWDGLEDKEVPVELKRAVAKIDVYVHYDWAQLLTDNNRGTYKLHDFGSQTFVGVNARNEEDKRVNAAEKNLTADPADANNKKVSLVTLYINEYDLTNTAASADKPPYITIKVKAADGPKELPGGQLPPPAGDTKDVVGSDHYYRIVLPNIIQRNCYYRLHAHINEAGSDGELGAKTLRFNHTVEPWRLDNMNFAPGYIRADFKPWGEGENL